MTAPTPDRPDLTRDQFTNDESYYLATGRRVTLTLEQYAECGARHPDFPVITSSCTQPIGHVGPHVSIDDYIQWEASDD